jgi:hypothetical protein
MTFFFFFSVFFFFLYTCCSHLEYSASVKRFVSLRFLKLKTVGTTPWTGDQPVAKKKQNKRKQISMPWVRLEPMIPVFERAKTLKEWLQRKNTDSPSCRTVTILYGVAAWRRKAVPLVGVVGDTRWWMCRQKTEGGLDDGRFVRQTDVEREGWVKCEGET